MASDLHGPEGIPGQQTGARRGAGTIAIAHSAQQESLLHETGADWTLWPFANAAEQASNRLLETAVKHKTHLDAVGKK